MQAALSEGMSISRLLVERHSAIAKVLLPTAVLFGFTYTLRNGATPYEDVKAAARKPLRLSLQHICRLKCNSQLGRDICYVLP